MAWLEIIFVSPLSLMYTSNVHCYKQNKYLNTRCLRYPLHKSQNPSCSPSLRLCCTIVFIVLCCFGQVDCCVTNVLWQITPFVHVGEEPQHRSKYHPGHFFVILWFYIESLFAPWIVILAIDVLLSSLSCLDHITWCTCYKVHCLFSVQIYFFVQQTLLLINYS